MFSRLKRTPRLENAVFSTRIKFKPTSPVDIVGELSLSDSYTFDNESFKQGKKVSGYEIATFVGSVINNELKPKFENIINIPIESIEEVGVYEGSIIVFFKVVFSALEAISVFKDLYESIELIRELANAHIQNRLKERYGDYFLVNTWTRLPTPDPNSITSEGVRNSNQSIPAIPNKNSVKFRDGFFYYLLISNIVLFALLGFMVYKAVLAMYW